MQLSEEGFDDDDSFFRRNPFFGLNNCSLGLGLEIGLSL